MKKTRKKVLGFLGLSVVVVMLGIALAIPNQRATATSTVTDTIQVRVVGSVPAVSISGIVDNAVYVNPERPFQVSYENVNTVTVSLKYTDLDGNTTDKILDEFVADYEPGIEDYVIDFVK